MNYSDGLIDAILLLVMAEALRLCFSILEDIAYLITQLISPYCARCKRKLKNKLIKDQ